MNLSPIQFRDPDLLHSIKTILGETGLAPEYLELELTEGTLMEDAESTLNTLRPCVAPGSAWRSTISAPAGRP